MNNSDTSFGLTEYELSDLIQHDSNLVICDLRKKEDFAKGHIKRSILVQYNEKTLLDIPKLSKVVLISKDEEQSKKMAIVLRSHDIEAFYLVGGIKNWSKGFYYTNISYVGTGYI
ncbi:MAG: rhodanese-like domain-containing protein [Nitrosarchaeum sp.]|nr:rhodanese-like domain-containing protein [Nitrosarchaeum sp.]